MTAPAVISGDCEHEDWIAQAQIIRETDPSTSSGQAGGPGVAMSVELTMTCAGCGAPMLWHGVRAGSDEIWERRTARPRGNWALQPLVSPDQTQIAIPCQPHPPGARS